MKLQSAIEAVVAENERLYSLNEQLASALARRLKIPHPMPSDYMPDKNFVKEDKAMFSDVRGAGGPVVTIARVQRRGTTRRLDMARRPPSMFRARSIRRASGLLEPPDAVRWENDHRTSGDRQHSEPRRVVGGVP